MNKRSIIALTCAFLAVAACAKEGSDLSTDNAKFSYAVGHNIAQNLKRQGLDLDVGAMSMAFEDVLGDKKARLSDEDMKKSIMAFQREKMKEHDAKAAKNLEDGKAFLAENAKKKDVKTTKSGIQYRVITEGKGKKPTAKDTVTVHYRGTLIDGQEFDSSYKRDKPATFPLSGVIKGWQEILPLMSEGAKWHIAVPSELAYGARGQGATIGPNSVLIFEIELIKVGALKN